MHATPRGLPWGSHRSSVVPMELPWASKRISMGLKFARVLMGLPCDIQGFTFKGLQGLLKGLPCTFYTSWVSTYWSKRFLLRFRGVLSWDFTRLPNADPRVSYGTPDGPMGLRHAFHGFTVLPWVRHGFIVWSMELPWLPWDFPCWCKGLLFHSRGTPIRLFWSFQCWATGLSHGSLMQLC